MTDIPRPLKAYIAGTWLEGQAKLPPLGRTVIGLALTESRFAKAIDPLLGWIEALETVIRRNPAIPIDRARIGAELMSTNKRNVMGIAAELHELAYLLPRTRTLRYYPDLPRPDLEADVDGRDIFIEVTTLRETKESEAEDDLREQLDIGVSSVPSGCLVIVDYGRGSFDRTMRDRLEAELKERLAKPPMADIEREELRIPDRGKALHRIAISIFPGKAPEDTTVVSHGNYKEHRSKRALKIREAARLKRPKFTGRGPNVLVLDGTIDYYPFQLSNVLRGQLRWEMIPVPEKGVLLPGDMKRGGNSLFKSHPELAAIVFKPHTRPLPESLVFPNEHIGPAALPLRNVEIAALGTLADEYGY